MTRLATEQRAAMLSQAIQRMDAWEEQYKAFLGDVKLLERRNRELAAEEDDPYLAGYKAGVAAAYRHIFDELLAMYYDFMGLKKEITAGVLGQPMSEPTHE